MKREISWISSRHCFFSEFIPTLAYTLPAYIAVSAQIHCKPSSFYSVSADAVWLQKFPNEGLVNVVNNVFDFDTYNKELRDTVTETLHKHGIPIGANPRNLQLAKE